MELAAATSIHKRREEWIAFKCLENVFDEQNGTSSLVVNRSCPWIRVLRIKRDQWSSGDFFRRKETGQTWIADEMSVDDDD